MFLCNAESQSKGSYSLPKNDIGIAEKIVDMDAPSWFSLALER
jgi:hypothetical protein